MKGLASSTITEHLSSLQRAEAFISFNAFAIKRMRTCKRWEIEEWEGSVSKTVILRVKTLVQVEAKQAFPLVRVNLLVERWYEVACPHRARPIKMRT